VTDSAKDVESRLETVKNTAASAISDAEKALDCCKNGPLKSAFDTCDTAVKECDKGVDADLADVQSAVDGLTKTVEYLGFTAAQKSVAGIRANIKSLDPARAALKMADDEEAAIEGVIKRMIKAAENILDVKKVEIAGDLRGMLDGSKPLQATILADIAKVEHAIIISYTFGDTKSFIEDLCKEGRKILKSYV
jgi:hypothetical protein